MAGRASGPGDQQRARRVLVEPVHQLGPIARVIGEPVEQTVEMMMRLGPALRREARRLVEDERVAVFMDDHFADQLFFLRRQRVALAFGPRRAGGRRIGRRELDHLARLDPVAGRRAACRRPEARRSAPSARPC